MLHVMESPTRKFKREFGFFGGGNEMNKNASGTARLSPMRWLRGPTKVLPVTVTLASNVPTGMKRSFRDEVAQQLPYNMGQ